jgi:5-methylcytosine-specific restriction endonuclease McrA
MENKARHKMKKAEYRARLLEAEGTHTAEDIRHIYEEQEGRCAYCGITLYDDYAVDHVVPLSRGGTNWPDNLAVACMFCNQSKHDRLLSEWGLFNKHDVWPLANLDGYYVPIAEGIEGET